MNGRTQEVIVGAALGGSSAINGMVYVRGTKEEYDGWKVLGGPGSTWEWNKMLPYFKKVSIVPGILSVQMRRWIFGQTFANSTVGHPFQPSEPGAGATVQYHIRFQRVDAAESGLTS
jgi:choline dehydrogenase-like flavoprotein